MTTPTAPIEIRPPSKATLKKYGIAADEWTAILAAQGNVCAICKKVPTTGRYVVDHFHAPKWKKLPADERKKHIRGILCWFCNHAYLGRGITIARARNVVTYLEAFQTKRETDRACRAIEAIGEVSKPDDLVQLADYARACADAAR